MTLRQQYHTEYRTWINMRRRCNGTHGRKADRLYRQKGIKVCPRWVTFENFLEDMGPRPDGKSSIDRIDGNGHYCPENCRWADDNEQISNRECTIRLTHEGVTKPITEWADLLGVKADTLRRRKNKGMSDALVLTVRKRNWKSACMITYQGVTKTATEWSKDLGCNRQALIHRYRRGWDHDKIIETPVGKTNSPTEP